MFYILLRGDRMLNCKKSNYNWTNFTEKYLCSNINLLNELHVNEYHFKELIFKRFTYFHDVTLGSLEKLIVLWVQVLHVCIYLYKYYMGLFYYI